MAYDTNFHRERDVIVDVDADIDDNGQVVNAVFKASLSFPSSPSILTDNTVELSWSDDFIAKETECLAYYQNGSVRNYKIFDISYEDNISAIGYKIDSKNGFSSLLKVEITVSANKQSERNSGTGNVVSNYRYNSLFKHGSRANSDYFEY